MELIKFDDFIKIIHENTNKWVCFTLKNITETSDSPRLTYKFEKNIKIIFVENEDTYLLENEDKKQEELTLEKLELKFKNEAWNIEKNNHYITP